MFSSLKVFFTSNVSYCSLRLPQLKTEGQKFVERNLKEDYERKKKLAKNVNQNPSKSYA